MCEARPAPVIWNVVKTLLLTVLLWAVFFFAVPAFLVALETVLGLNAYRFTGPLWLVAGCALFILGSSFHMVANLYLAIRGEGTPLLVDCPRRLVIAGPYRHVRNPIAIASFLQVLGVALYLGSPLVLVYAVALPLLDHFLLVPPEEADLERRFGEDFRRYRRRVRCWRPRWRGYDPTREAEETPLAAEQTTAPGRCVVLYDGLCKFCTAGARQLAALAQPGALELVSFQEPGVLDQFPGISHEACMRQMYLVTPTGRVYGGFEAAVQAVATRRVFGLVAYGYYLPGVRWLCDTLYAAIAARRYRILGKTVAAGECADGTCALHFSDGRLPQPPARTDGKGP